MSRSRSRSPRGSAEVEQLRVCTWNVAGVSGNVFEFWGLAPDEIVEAAEAFLLERQDVTLAEVLTEGRAADLRRGLEELGWPAIPDAVVADLRGTGLLQYMSDRSVGKKRLVSLPDRVTAQLGRPGVTTAFVGDCSSLDAWWAEWLRFMFAGCGHAHIRPHPAKYAAELTAQEVALSQSLQLLHLALYDGALIRVLNEAAPGWMEAKRRLVAVDKTAQAAKIVQDLARDHDILLLQEVTLALRRALEAALPDFVVVAPPETRGQDSIVVVRKALAANVRDATGSFDYKMEAGDGCVVRATVGGRDIILGSFHGDSDGQATIPFVRAFAQYVAGAPCLLGIDANVGGKLASADFRAAIKDAGLHSCLREDVWTTFKARTFVQPQFQKAVRRKDLATQADKAPKDHILASRASLAAAERITTSDFRFVDAPIPTHDFPSDHAVVTTRAVLQPSARG